SGSGRRGAPTGSAARERSRPGGRTAAWERRRARAAARPRPRRRAAGWSRRRLPPSGGGEVRHPRVDRLLVLGVDPGRADGGGGAVRLVAGHAVVVALRVPLLDALDVGGGIGLGPGLLQHVASLL